MFTSAWFGVARNSPSKSLWGDVAHGCLRSNKNKHSAHVQSLPVHKQQLQPTCEFALKWSQMCTVYANPVPLVQPMFQHADATVLELNGSAALERVQVAIRGQAQWVPEAQRCLSRVIGVIGVIYCVKLSCQVSSPQFWFISQLVNPTCAPSSFSKARKGEAV